MGPTPGQPDISAQLEGAARALALVLNQTFSCATVAIINDAIKAAGAEIAMKADDVEASMLGKIVGGLLGGIAAPGVEASTNAILNHLITVATSKPTA